MLSNAESEGGNAGVLPINDTTLSMLRDKHPDGCDMPDEIVLYSPREDVEPVIFETIDAELIGKLAFSMKGASGSSKFDANDRQRILATKIYGAEGHDLCNAIARMARQHCTEDVTDPESISAAMACRLIPLDKNPGLRPIGNYLPEL